MVFTSWRISCPLARMSCYSQNCFLIIPIMASTSSEIALTKKYCFHQTKNKLFLWKLFSGNSSDGFHLPKIVLIKTQFPQDRILYFNEILHSDLVEMDFLATGKVFFCSEILLSVETVSDISGGQFLQKYYILTNGNWFSG